MTSPTEISIQQLSDQIGLAYGPAIIDVRIDEDFASNPRLIPGSCRRRFREVDRWAGAYADDRVVVVCEQGQKLSQGVAALLRHGGTAAVTLAGGFRAWAEAGAVTIAADRLRADEAGHTVWVTGAGLTLDAGASAWLIRRFVDRDAVLMFVAPEEVARVADRFDAVPFADGAEVPGGQTGQCGLDRLIADFDLTSPALSRLAAIAGAASGTRVEPAAEADGLSAIGSGLFELHDDDLARLSAALPIFDALYRTCFDRCERSADHAGTGLGR